MKTLASTLLLTTLLLAAAPACQKPPIEGQADQYWPAQINFTDQSLADDTTIGKPKLTRDESNLLHVDVPIRNLTDMQMIIDYRVTFVDANGSPVAPATGWSAFTLAPNVYSDLTFNSATPRAADFRLQLRYAQ